MQTLAGKRALVCGSSQGIGRACAMEIARLGASVTVVSRNEQALQEVASDLPKETDQSHGYFVADFTQPGNVQSKVADHVHQVGTVHILVNNTGGPPSGPAFDADADAFIQAFSNHLICNQHLVQAVVPGMKESKFGRIINMISTSVIQPITGLGVSNTTRGAVANWGRTLAGELAPFGITVNNILPGYTNTDRLQSLFKRWSDRDGITIPEVEERVRQSIPMRRLARPEEIGAVVAFLATPAASYVSGVNLPVDGARTAVQ